MHCTKRTRQEVTMRSKKRTRQEVTRRSKKRTWQEVTMHSTKRTRQEVTMLSKKRTWPKVTLWCTKRTWQEVTVHCKKRTWQEVTRQVKDTAGSYNVTAISEVKQIYSNTTALHAQVQEDTTTERKNQNRILNPVLWIRIGSKADPDSAFLVSAYPGF